MGSQYHNQMVSDEIIPHQIILFGAFVFLFLMNLHLCIECVYAAFMRYNRFAISQKHIVLSYLLTWIMIISPFLGTFYSMGYTFLGMALLIYSQLKSKIDNEGNISFLKSNAFKNCMKCCLLAVSILLFAFYPYPEYLVEGAQ